MPALLTRLSSDPFRSPKSLELGKAIPGVKFDKIEADRGGLQTRHKDSRLIISGEAEDRLLEGKYVLFVPAGGFKDGPNMDLMAFMEGHNL